MRGKRIGNYFVLGGPVSAGCGPAPRATSCFSHLSSETKTQKQSEKHVFFRNATDIEAALMTFEGSGRSFSASSKFEKTLFSKKCQH